MDQHLVSLKAVADEVRVRILLLLSQEEACVCELMRVFKMTQSRLSHHLIVLRKAGLLIDEKRGKWNYYKLARSNGFNKALLEALQSESSHDAVLQRDKNTFVQVKKHLRITC